MAEAPKHPESRIKYRLTETLALTISDLILIIWFFLRSSMRRLFKYNFYRCEYFKSFLSCFHSHSVSGPGCGPVPAKVRPGKLQTL
jgi:hypothetical protein